MGTPDQGATFVSAAVQLSRGEEFALVSEKELSLCALF